MALITQQLRTTTATKIPDGLNPGQIAFNLANGWMMVGVGGTDILINGVAVSGYGSGLTIFGVSNVAVPAKPAANTGYEIFRLEDQPAAPPTSIYSGADNAVEAVGGAGFGAKITAYLVANEPNVTAVGDLKAGDTFIATDGGAGAQTVVKTGSYVYDGNAWVALGGGSLPDATARTGTAATGAGGTKGVVYLARDIDVKETGAPDSVTPDPLAVATAAQVKALADRVGALAVGHAFLGTWDASSGNVQAASPMAATGGRANLANGDPLDGATGLVAGDYFMIATAGTPTGLTGAAASLNGKAFTVGDQVVYDGAEWREFTSPPPPSNTLHGLSDVADAATAAVVAADVKGLLVRDNSVPADGSPGAYKLVSVLDLGTF